MSLCKDVKFDLLVTIINNIIYTQEKKRKKKEENKCQKVVIYFPQLRSFKKNHKKNSNKYKRMTDSRNIIYISRIPLSRKTLDGHSVHKRNRIPVVITKQVLSTVKRNIPLKKCERRYKYERVEQL